MVEIVSSDKHKLQTYCEFAELSDQISEANEQDAFDELSQFSQFIIVAGFGVICFACGYLIAFIVVRNSRRDEMIKRGVARYNWWTGKWEWGEPPKDRS